MNKYIVKTIFNFKLLFLAEKGVLFHWGKQYCNKYVDGFWWEDNKNHFFQALLRTILIRNNNLKLKCFNDGFVSYKQSFASQDIDEIGWCGLLMDYCDVFIIIILMFPIPCIESIVKQVIQS